MTSAPADPLPSGEAPEEGSPPGPPPGSSPLADQVPTARPILVETLVGVEWAALHLTPVYWGLGVPRGDGAVVIPVPGFLGSDLYLLELRLWLGRVGYRARRSRIGRNAECLEILADRLLGTIEHARAVTGRRKVHLVGHSLGGIIARATATLKPEWVASVITLASPFRGIRSHPFVLEMGELVRRRIESRRGELGRPPACYTGYCRCPLVKATKLPFPENVPQLAVYTRGDGIVNWRFCMSRTPSANYEVPGTHAGLVFNPWVYAEMARFLAGLGGQDR